MKRTLMLRSQELLDFEVDLETGAIRILYAPDTGDALLPSLGLDGPNREAVNARGCGEPLRACCQDVRLQ